MDRNNPTLQLRHNTSRYGLIVSYDFFPPISVITVLGFLPT